MVTTGARTNSPTAYSKNYHFWQKNYVPRRATPTRIASHGAPQARKQAIWGDLGRYSSQNRLPRARTPPKIASHEVVLRGTISLSTRTVVINFGPNHTKSAPNPKGALRARGLISGPRAGFNKRTHTLNPGQRFSCATHARSQPRTQREHPRET